MLSKDMQENKEDKCSKIREQTDTSVITLGFIRLNEL